MDEENEVLEAIEMQTKAVETRMGGVDAELKKLRADLTKSDRDNAELERKVNMLSIAQPATGTADGNKAPPHELFNLQVKSNFGPSRSALNAEAFAEYKAAFNKWIRYGDRFLDGAEQKAMSVGVDTDGGYLAPPEYARQIIKVEQLNSVMRGLVTAIPMGAGSLELPASTGLPTAGWVGETEPRPATATSPIGKLEIFAKEIYAEPEVTQTLLDDAAFDIESFLGGLVGDAFAVAEDAAFISGNGVKVPQGFLTYSTSNKTDLSGTRNFGEIQYVASGQAGAWPSTDDAIYDFLVDIVMALKPGYRRNASWVMPTSVIQKVMKIKDAQKQPIWQQSLIAGQPSRLLGYPVTEAEQMPVVAANSYSIAFADWKRAYWITDRYGVRLLRDPYTNKPFVRFYTTKRMGGGIVDSLAIKLGKFSAS
jgi:HK97 family phage major capsid protein